MRVFDRLIGAKRDALQLHHLPAGDAVQFAMGLLDHGVTLSVSARSEDENPVLRNAKIQEEERDQLVANFWRCHRAME